MLNGASERADLAAMYPALWLKRFPPQRSIQIRQATSWSCHHGIERWRKACGCTPFTAGWKAPFRTAINRLDRALDRVYMNATRALIPDPDALRDEYIYVLLNERPARDLIQDHAGRRLPDRDLSSIQMLLQAQVERQRMQTSCGWFFEDFDRIEPRNNVAYAAHSVLLTKQATGVDLSPQAVADLQKVVSPRSGLRGDQLFTQCFRRAKMSWHLYAS